MLFRSLSSELAAKLAPFIAAYRPHDPIPSRAELLAAGYERIQEESFTDEMREYYYSFKGHYPGDS